MSRKDGTAVSTRMTTGEIFQVVSVSRLVCLFRISVFITLGFLITITVISTPTLNKHIF